MRVLVTGASGFIGSAIVQELVDAGHKVTGLARSEASANKLEAMGAGVLRGDITDLDVLKRGAAAADGAIQTAFYHAIGQIPLGTRLGVLLGGAPGGIVGRFVSAAVRADRRAMEVMGEELAGRKGALIGTFGTMGMKAGRIAREDEPYDPDAIGGMRSASEKTLKDLASRGVRTSAIRLPPIVHGAGDRGFAHQLIGIARKKKEAGYLGDGTNRWASVHRLDAARLYRLALEKGSAGGTYHGVAEEGIAFREIAGLMGRMLDVPVAAKSDAEAKKQFSFLSLFVGVDNPVSSHLTQERLGWRPAETGLLHDLEHAGYFNR